MKFNLFHRFTGSVMEYMLDKLNLERRSNSLPNLVDLGLVTHVCSCGSQMWEVEWMIFEDYMPAAYSLNMKCVCCGAKAITPTECDRPEFSGENFVTV